MLAKVAGRFKGKTFHAVGGAWRNLAIVRMNRIGYPLQVVQQFEMSASDAIETAGLVAAMSRGALERLTGVSKKRAETLPYSAVVMRALVETLGFERIVISSYGLREGLLFDAMSPEVQALDPLIEGCSALGLRHGVAERLGPAVEAWLSPMWARLEPVFPAGRDRVLMAAASRLADVGARLHPDHRADLVFDQVLRATIPGQSHAERTFLALAAFHRYGGEAPKDPTVQRILTPERIERAQALGAAVRLAAQVSGRSPELLAASSLALAKGELTLSLKKASADLLLGEQTSKRAQALAAILKAELKVKVR